MIEQIVTVPAGAKGVDFAYWRPGDEIAQDAYVVRYICRRPNPKAVTRAEIDFYHSLRVAVVLVFEQGQADWQQGAAKGEQQGALAASEAALLGYPRGLVVIFAFDTNAQPADDRARSYGNAAADTIEPVGYLFGPYSDLDVINVLADRSALNWLAGATSWSDPTKPYQPETMPGYELVHVRQVISGSTPNYDNNITLRPFPAWLPHDTPVEPPIEVLPTSPEVDMRAFTHSDNDHDGHPPRWTFWCYETGGTKRHILGHELTILGGPDAAPSISMAEIDLIPDYVAPGPGAPVTHLSGTWSTS